MLKRVLLAAGAMAMPAFGAIAVEARTDPKSEPHLVKLSPLRIPIVDGSTVTGSLEVELMFDAVDAAAAARLTATVPRLRAASVAATAEFAHLYPSSLAPVDVDELSRTVTKALRHENPDIARVLVVTVAASSG